jgi:hypothetical protein
LWTKWHWPYSNYFGSPANIIPPMLHNQEGAASDNWESSNKAMLFQRLGIIKKEVLCFFQRF